MKTEAQNIDLKTFPFPKLNAWDLAFPTFDSLPKLLKEAEARGFDDQNNPYCKLFSKLFFTGGEVKFKKGLDQGFVERAWPYCKALMGSFAPKHEHKEAVCAMLLSELVECEF